MDYLFYIYISLVLLMSLITFFAYKIDKNKAIKGKWRTSEKTLLLLSFLFGALGGLSAMYTNRHKNRVWYFILVNYVSLIIHIVIAYFIYIN